MTVEQHLAHVAQIIAALMFIIMGASHLIQPKAWVTFFTTLQKLGDAGVFANAFMSLWFGILIVSLHNIWTWPAIILTLIGWAQVLKASVGFIAPSISMRGLMMVSPENEWRFVAAGVPSFSLGLWFLFDAVGR